MGKYSWVLLQPSRIGYLISGSIRYIIEGAIGVTCVEQNREQQYT